MRLMDRVGMKMECWRIPKIGETAGEDLPAWLLAGITDGTVRFNRLGGLDLAVDGVVTSSSLPGDTLVRQDDGRMILWNEEGFRALRAGSTLH